MKKKAKGKMWRRENTEMIVRRPYSASNENKDSKVLFHNPTGGSSVIVPVSEARAWGVNNFTEETVVRA